MIVSIRELQGWQPFSLSSERVEFRPAFEGIKLHLGIAGMALLLSLLILFMEGWRSDLLHVGIHLGLWILAVSWAVSLFYVHMTFIKDPMRGLVWVRGQGVVVPCRRRFPIGSTEISLTCRRHYQSVGKHGHRQTGHDWVLMLREPDQRRPLLMRIGFTEGLDVPDRIPTDVDRLSRILADMFETRIGIVPMRQ